MRFDRLAVIGIGLIGGSFALAAKERGLVGHVIGVARKEQTRADAVAVGVADEATADASEAVREADLVYVSTPVCAVPGVFETIAPSLRPGTLVTDAGSTKSSTISAAAEFLTGRCTFIGGHPMAGSEQAGPRAARASLFVGRTYFLTPTPETHPEGLALLSGLLRTIGANVRLCNPEDHDRTVALTSHLPHLLASALCATLGDLPSGVEGARPFVGSGFRDSTRIAKSPPEVWRDILRDNRDHVLGALACYESRVARLRAALEDDDPRALEDLWRETAQLRRGLDEQ